jgi:hypothetical protein
MLKDGDDTGLLSAREGLLLKALALALAKRLPASPHALAGQTEKHSPSGCLPIFSQERTLVQHAAKILHGSNVMERRCPRRAKS